MKGREIETVHPFKNRCCDVQSQFYVRIRVARWFIFGPKIPIWADFVRVLDWKMLLYFMAIGNILWTFVIFHDHLVIGTFCVHLVTFKKYVQKTALLHTFSITTYIHTSSISR
jgi:hypothetical protein